MITACSQMSVVNVKSNPDQAEVFVRALGSTERILVGKTPIELSSSDLQDKLKTNGLIIIEVIREQHYKEEFFLSDYNNRNVEISYDLRQLPKIDQAKKVDVIIADLFNCQRLVKVKRFAECQKILSNLKNKYPEVSTIYEFEGSIFYIKRERKKALQSFLTALKFNSNNQEAKRMIRIIKGESK